MSNIRAALEAFKPELAEDFSKFATRRFERLVEQFGPALRGVYNSDQVNNWKAIAAVTAATGNLISDPRVIDPARLAAAATRYADDVVEAWVAKIEAKMGELESAEVSHLDGARFAITGTKGGRAVRIEQDRIVNVSSKGTLFNQWPARIYVEGKFTSAAKFAQL